MWATFLETYLIKFPGRDLPEKQTVSFFIKTSIYFKSHNIDAQLDMLNIAGAAKANSVIEIEIEHTDVSWGIDIENILTNVLLSRVKKGSFFGQGPRLYLPILLSLALVFGVPKVYDYVNSHYSKVNLANAISKIESAPNIDVFDKISMKIQLLADPPSLTSAQEKIIIFQVIALLVAISIAMLELTVFDVSYLNLNSYSKTEFENKQRWIQWKKYGLIAGFAISTVSGLFTSWITAYFAWP